MKKFVSLLCFALFALIGLAPKFKAFPPFDDEIPIKVIFLGDAGVGKTSIIQRIVVDNGAAIDQLTPTNYADFHYKKIISSDRPCLLQLWDTAGQEKYDSLSALFVRQANVAGVVCSSDVPSSYEKVDHWINEVKKVEPNAILLLIVNKSDSDRTEAEALEQQLKNNYCDKYSTFLTSAKTGDGISDLLQAICDSYLSNYDTKMAEKMAKENGIDLTANLEHEKKKCCK